MTTAVFLDVQSLAAELAIGEVEAKRLIAKNRVQATRMGDAGPWRITTADVEKYVAAGARDLRPHELGFDAPWFDNSLAYMANEFESAVLAAAEEQQPSDETIMRDIDSDRFKSSFDYPIKNTGAVAAVVRRAVPQAVYGVKASGVDESGRFATWADLYAVDVLRREAFSILSMPLRGASRPIGLKPAGDALDPVLSKLYDSPDRFESITQQAYRQASAKRIGYSKTFYVEDNVSRRREDRRAFFMFDKSNFMPSSAASRLINMAF